MNLANPLTAFTEVVPPSVPLDPDEIDIVTEAEEFSTKLPALSKICIIGCVVSNSPLPAGSIMV